jgi:hypothetical protein
MGWTERAKDAAKGLGQTEAGRDFEQKLRQKLEEDLDEVLGKPEDPAKPAADDNDTANDGDQP